VVTDVLLKSTVLFCERNEMGMKNILILENDLGFIFWLGSALAAADYQPWPACTVSDAIDLVGKAAISIDMLIIDPSVSGVSKLTAALRRSQADLKVIALGAGGKTKLPGVDAWHRKPGPAEEPVKQQQEWIEVIRDVFVGHKCAA
jgi:hypothetical protein